MTKVFRVTARPSETGVIVGRISLKSHELSDAVILRPQVQLTDAEMESIREQVGAFFPKRLVVVLDHAIEFVTLVEEN